MSILNGQRGEVLERVIQIERGGIWDFMRQDLMQIRDRELLIPVLSLATTSPLVSQLLCGE